MHVEITKGDSAGEVVAVDDEKGRRMIAADVAVETDKKPVFVPKKQPKADKVSEK